MFAATTLALVLAAAQGETHTLKWKLNEGDVFYNKTAVTMDQSFEIAGMSMDQKIEMKTVLRFKVKSAKPGATVVDMTFLESKFDAQGLPGFNIGNKLKDVTFTATLDDKMKVTKLEGYDKFLDAITEGDADQKKLMKAMMPEATIRQSFGQTFVIAPDKPVAVGDKWDRTDKMALGPLGNVETKAAYKLDSVKGDVATISMKGDLTFKAGDGDDAGLPFKIEKADLKAENFTGTHKFDMKAGRLSEFKMQMEMAGTMTIGVAGMTVDAKMKQKMTTTGSVTEKNPIVD
jgi:uncharacterized protein DUF6263